MNKYLSYLYGSAKKIGGFKRSFEISRVQGLLWLMRNKPRFKDYKIKIFGLVVHLCDPRSFYFEFVHIFGRQIYRFKTDKKNPTIIDGGGYIGLSCLYFKTLFPGSKILTFEPDKSALVYLKKNLQANNLSDVRVIEKGLYDNDTEISFCPDQTDGGKIDERGEVKVAVTKLSNYINEEIDFLKLNIEGAEISVMRDLHKNNKLKFIRELCLEWHSFKNEQQNLAEILEILSANNFRYYIGNFRNSPKGEFSRLPARQYYLLVYGKNMSEK